MIRLHGGVRMEIEERIKENWSEVVAPKDEDSGSSG